MGSVSAGGSAVDNSAVARIALHSKAISAGVTTTTASVPQQASMPFGIGRSEQKSDPQVLMSKRVEAATRAMEIAKQVVRRTINFDDDRFLRKLIKTGLQEDEKWKTAYQDFCSARGVSDGKPKNQDK